MHRLVALFLAVAAASYSSAQSPLPTDNAQAYGALFALMQFRRPSPNIVISAKTLNVGCGVSSGNPILMNDCGIFIAQQNQDEIYKELGAVTPDLLPETWQRFLTVNNMSTILPSTLVNPFNGRIADIEHAEKTLASIDGIVLVSSVGFNQAHTQAIIYSLFLSYMSDVPSSGNLFVFTRKSGSWQPAGRLTLMQLGK